MRNGSSKEIRDIVNTVLTNLDGKPEITTSEFVRDLINKLCDAHGIKPIN